MTSEKEIPASKIDLAILGNSYSLDFPNVGQLIDIERLKIKMSGSTYNELLFGTTRQSQLAFTAVEAIATFTVLIPKLKEDLTLKSLLELPLPRVKELTDVYEKQFYPWYKDWFNIINEESSVKEEELSEEKEEKKSDNYEIVS
jgi:hypothetical protein